VQQKTGLVTGASSGIGYACTARLAAHGWRVYAGVRRQEDAGRLVRELKGEVVPVILDVTRTEHITAALNHVSSEVEGLDGLVNNAGIALGGPVETCSDQDWRRILDVNFFAVVAMTREAFPLVRAAGGRFVHIGSISGRVGTAGLAPYVASKHALEGFNWSLRQELRGDTGMHSSLIEPGIVATGIWDKSRVAIDRLDGQLSGAARRRYEHMVDAMRGFVDEGSAKGIDPDRVAQVVERALTAKRPKARYLVGPDAKMTGLLERLPDRVVEGFMARNTERLRKRAASA
jgi:NAD(P)-dependent dehydrogenase (short-subunit alcohol dehydrogenase family)